MQISRFAGEPPRQAAIDPDGTSQGSVGGFTEAKGGEDQDRFRRVLPIALAVSLVLWILILVAWAYLRV